MTVAAEVARKREVCGDWQLGCGAGARLGGLRGAPCVAGAPLAEYEAAPHGTRSVPCLLHLLCGWSTVSVARLLTPFAHGYTTGNATTLASYRAAV